MDFQISQKLSDLLVTPINRTPMCFVHMRINVGKGCQQAYMQWADTEHCELDADGVCVLQSSSSIKEIIRISKENFEPIKFCWEYVVWRRLIIKESKA
jgi:hypothetical protein